MFNKMTWATWHDVSVLSNMCSRKKENEADEGMNLNDSETSFK